MPINPTQLRADLYNILDQILETQQPVEIIRHGKLLEISVKHTLEQSKLAHLIPHPGTILGDPEALVHCDWSHEWKGHHDL